MIEEGFIVMSKPIIPKYSLDSLQNIRKNIAERLREAEKGKKNCYEFIRYHLDRIQRPLTKEGQRAQVIVIGGSNLISSVVEQRRGYIAILDTRKRELPPLKDKGTVLRVLRETLEEDIEHVTLNFAYPMETVYRDGRIDGRLLKATKEHSFTGMVGNCIGEEFERYMYDETGRRVIAMVANDTVCLVLSGLEDDVPSRIVGGIIGTGFNFGFFLDDQTVINLEAGNFDGFEQTDSGKLVDKFSSSPGVHIFEKEIAGGYLYQHYNMYAKQFGFTRNNSLSSSLDLNMVALNDPVQGRLARALFKRSASLVATQMAAIYDFKGLDRLVFVIEGTLFWNGVGYKDSVYRVLEKLGLSLGEVKIKKIEKSYILGGAYLLYKM